MAKETEQVILLRAAGIKSPNILAALSTQDLDHVRWVVEHNQGHIALMIAKLFAGDWSPLDPEPKIFSVMGRCPVCGGDLAECQGLHGLAKRWSDEVLEGRDETDQRDPD